MKHVFTGSFTELQNYFVGIDGDWDDSQPNKKVFRARGGVLNWYESTGTIQFQGKEPGKSWLEKHFVNALNPDLPGDTSPDEEELWQTKPEYEQECADNGPKTPAEKYLDGRFDESELVIGIVTAVGTETARVVTPLTDRLRHFGYEVEVIRVSTLLPDTGSVSEYERIRNLMRAGDALRKSTKNNAILAYGAAKLIREQRDEKKPKRAYIVNSLKHPDEVELLRRIYGQGFYLFGIHADRIRRLSYLTNDKGLTSTQAAELAEIDEDERVPHGQRTRDTYHLADFFLNFGKNDDQVKNTIQRFLELIFSHPYKNPTFDEFSMFMAFSSSVRSGDLSRQVGAVITRDQQILATGANECPVSGGGLYWSKVDPETGEVIEVGDGKDFTREQDSNKAEQREIIQSILRQLPSAAGTDEDLKSRLLELEEPFRDILEQSRISDLTEFGRVVHAEMEAILSCARAGIECVDSTMYCTTFPCHNCAKHIIASGVERVVYVEPYPKSKALELHSESIELKTKLDDETVDDRVVFEPFTGVGARRFLDFFSMNLGAGNKLRRKNKDGSTVSWEKKDAQLRVSLLPASYRDIEDAASRLYSESEEA